MDLAINILSGIFVFVALLMILVILMQRPKSEGLGAAFGGGVTENIFGAQTTNVLTRITGWLAAIFFLLCFTLSILYAQKSNSSSNLGERVKKNLPPPVATTSATPTSTPSPGPSGTVGPSTTATSSTPAATGPAPSVKPADLAVGAVPPAPLTSAAPPATSPAISVQPSAGPSVSASPRR
jgi:preprotein translocase subunit SecG